MSKVQDRMLSVEGVMVSYNYSEGADQANIITVAASGMKFSKRWVLTHGSILSPLKQAQILKKSKGKSILNEQFYFNLPEIYVTCEKGVDSLDKDYEGVTTLAAKRDERDLDLEHHSYQVRVLTGRICHVWQCPILDRCVDDILYSWTIGHRDGDMEKQTQLGKALLSVFVLVDLESDDRDFKTLRPLSELYDLVRFPPDRGADLEVHSTPFGCEVFLNGVTRGTVCGVVGRRPSLLLTDAATALGSEGAPVFTDTGSLVGSVVCSVSWWRGEWVGLTLVAPLHAVLGAKLHIAVPDVRLSDKDSKLRARSKLHQVILESLDRVVVLVRCGAAWGAGVYLGGGRALTAAHVVTNCEREKVSMYCQGVKETAIVLYKTTEDKAFDLALVYSNPEDWAHLKPAHFATEPAKKGETVLAVGYPFFNENNLDSLKPMITRGHVNNVSPSMIQTSCCVQSGFSGGAICRLVERGGGLVAEVLGVIICNAKTSAACYPYINMAVPASAFVQLLNQYYVDKDKSKLKEIEQKKEMIQSQWRLMPYKSKI